MNIFIDTNILLDVLRAREPFLKNSLAIWALVEREKFEGYISAISFNHTYYVLRATVGNAKAYEAMRILRGTFRVVALDERIMNNAIDADFKDFEDAIQFFSAIHANANYIVTRNVKDFSRNDIPVLTPEAFLSIGVDA